MAMMKVAGKTANDTAKGMGVTSDGEVLSVRRFESIDPTVIVPADTAIRDTERHTTTSVQCDIYKYPVNSIVFYTTLNAAINVKLLDGSHISNTNYLYHLDGSAVEFEIPANTGNTTKAHIITSEDIPELDYLKYLKLNYAAKTTPTSGVIRVEVIHKG